MKFNLSKEEVSAEAVKSLYGTSRKAEVDLSKSNKNAAILPSFNEIMKYVYTEAENRLKEQNATKDSNLAFDVKVYTEVLIYLRLCLIRNLNVPLTREIMKHPCDVSPVIKKYLNELYDAGENHDDNALFQYVTLVQRLMLVNPGTSILLYLLQVITKYYLGPEPLCCMLEIVGCVPKLHTILTKNIQWLRDLLTSVNENIRELASMLYAIVISHAYNNDDFEKVINFLISQCSNRNLEAQHGAVLTIGNCIERRIMLKKYDQPNLNNDVLKSAINTIGI